ncbi:hypothetical protein GCM10010331_44670 [Streptomyces xanthochromogenes]|uniref:hypothetical protein n=1 Tax=Streptomyces xanthochromogenes TaxID=67384 RepID=UPI0016746E92|nr:hypothetical protein [Streptomyces xanthochromogenes]GHB52150.1 hypothetical protein GCM10010331_44670 [Streptomyces xanthochromogenes]
MQGHPYRVELNRDVILDLWRCGPCVLELEPALVRELRDAEPDDLPKPLRADSRIQPLRARLHQDVTGVLATTEDIRAWFQKLIKTSPEQLTEEQEELVRSWPKNLQGRIGRVPEELITLWRTLRPQLADAPNILDIEPDQVFRGLREALIDNPESFSKEERSMIMDMQAGVPLTLEVVALYARREAAVQKVKRS